MIVAILPLLTVALATDYVGNADAEKAKGKDGLVPPKSYGKRTAKIVCGDHLCSESGNSLPLKIES